MKLSKLFATVGIAALIGASVATPAKAAYADCSPSNFPGTICFTQHGDYSGTIWRQYPWQVEGCITLYGFNDMASTAFNNTSANHQLYLYEHAGCTGNDFILASGQNVVFNGSLSWWNDKVSSFYILEF